MEPKEGQYYYAPYMSGYKIYVWANVTEHGCSAKAVDGEPLYYEREEAKRRVYELNGWKMKNR